MSTPRGSDQSPAYGAIPPDDSEPRTIDTTEHCICGLVGAVTTALIVPFLYPTLIALTTPLHLLSLTTLVVVLVALWFLIWLGLEFLWEWRAGRLHTAG